MVGAENPSCLPCSFLHRIRQRNIKKSPSMGLKDVHPYAKDQALEEASPRNIKHRGQNPDAQPPIKA